MKCGMMPSKLPPISRYEIECSTAPAVLFWKKHTVVFVLLFSAILYSLNVQLFSLTSAQLLLVVTTVATAENIFFFFLLSVPQFFYFHFSEFLAVVFGWNLTFHIFVVQKWEIWHATKYTEKLKKENQAMRGSMRWKKGKWATMSNIFSVKLAPSLKQLIFSLLMRITLSIKYNIAWSKHRHV